MSSQNTPMFFSGLNKSWAYLFFSPAGKTLGASGSLRLFFACASASSSHACNIGFNAIMLLWDNVKLSNLHMVLCERAPTPGNFKFANALPTSACVTPAFERSGSSTDNRRKTKKKWKKKQVTKRVQRRKKSNGHTSRKIQYNIEVNSGCRTGTGTMPANIIHLCFMGF